MNQVIIKRIDSNRIIFDCPSKELFRLLKSKFFKIDGYDYYNRPIKSYLFTVDTSSKVYKIIMHTGFFHYLLKELILNNYLVEYDDSLNDPQRIVISDKWKNILDSNYRVIDNKNQFNYLSELLKYNRASSQFYTGYGKTELILAIVESYLDQYDRNVVVLVPDNTIKMEFISRSSKWDLSITPEYHKFTSRFQLINPIGLIRKGKVLNDKIKDYLNNTGLVIIDEVHHLSANSYISLLDNYLTNYDFIYGLSGTIDSKLGNLPTFNSNLSEFPSKLLKIIQYLSIPRLDIKNPSKILISFLNVKSRIVPEAIKGNYLKSIKILFNSPDLINELIHFLRTHPTRRLFLPIIEINQGKKLADLITKELGPKTCIFKSGAGTYPEVTDLGYESLKSYLSDCEDFRVIIGTSSIYEGFDSDRINTILLGLGNSQRMTIQPTGRGTRSDDIPWVLLPLDTSNNNPVVNKQSRSRYSILKREFKNHIVLPSNSQIE